MKSMLLVQVIARAAAYDATWASLDGRPAPSWFRDAKFGIKMHWGMYSVPSWNDLEPRQDAARRADATSRRHGVAATRTSPQAAQYWRFLQAAPGCPKAQNPTCKGDPYGGLDANNSIRAFHERAYPSVDEYRAARESKRAAAPPRLRRGYSGRRVAAPRRRRRGHSVERASITLP